MNLVNRYGCGLMLLAAISLPAMAQGSAQAGNTLVFDVATIKVNNSSDNGRHTTINDGVFIAVNIPLKSLLAIAYGIKPDLIFGVPDAMSSLNFDVTAKMLNPDPEAYKKLRDVEKLRLLEPVIAERFHLKTHTETRQQPVYELTTLPSGPRMKSVQGDGDGDIHMSGSEMVLQHMDTGRLAGFLSNILQRTVIDKTGLKGPYDLDLKWTPEGADQSQPDAPPNIFTAVEEQLGLRLRSAKGPVQVLIVDAITPPTEN